MPSCVLTFRSAPIALLGVTVWFALASANRLFATDPRIYLIERFGTNQITIHFDTDANRTYELQYTSTLQCRTNVSGQYYLRTKGEQGFEFGDEIIVSGGPGAYVVLHDAWTLNLQLNADYDTQARDRLLGRRSDRTGMTAWYLGPQIGFTWGEHLAGNIGIDAPLHITSNGFQNVPDYRVHGGLNFRF